MSDTPGLLLKPVNAFRLIAATVTLVCLYLFAPWQAGFAYLMPLPDSIQQQVEAFEEYDLDGIIVYIDGPKHHSQLYSAGFSNKITGTPIKPNSLFKIASISKLYMASAAAILIDQKALTLDAPITDYLPYLASRISQAHRISVRMLIQHRSGIQEWVYDPRRWSIAPTDIDGYLSLVFDKPLEFEPDNDYQYSNTNYLLLGKIMDKVLGYPHQRFIKQQILTPLNLQDTFGSQLDIDNIRLTSGYDVGYQDDFKPRLHLAPGGTMISTASDTGRFIRALHDGVFFTPQQHALYADLYTFEHTGLVAGYSSIARYNHDTDTVIVQLVNTSGGNSWIMTEVMFSRILKLIQQQSNPSI